MLSRKEKIRWLYLLQRLGIVDEQCPVHDGAGGTAYWRFFVTARAWLPEFFKEEFRRLGELRW